MRYQSCVLGVGLALVSATAEAQLQKETGGTAAAGVSGGKTDVVKEGFQKAAEDKEEERKKKVSELAFNIGGLFTAGNSRSSAVTVGIKSRLRRGDHQLSLAMAGNYARTGKVGTESTTTVENLQGMARYDYFVLKPLAIFAQLTGRRDRFQGLDLRLNADIGAAYFFVQEEKQRLWAELGYDFQFDSRTDDVLNGIKPGSGATPDPTCANSPGRCADRTKVSHSVRSFLGYENKLNETVSFITSLEYLQSVQHADAARLNFDIGIKAQVVNHLSVATTYSMRYDNAPLKGVVSSDSIAAVNLVYTLF